MAQNGGVVFTQTSFISAASSFSEAKAWNGNNCNIVFGAQAIGNNVGLYLIGIGARPGFAGYDCKVNSGFFGTGGSIQHTWLPAGNYQLKQDNGSSTNVYCGIFPTS